MVKINENQHKIHVTSPTYAWEWDAETDIFNLYDANLRLISRAKHKPLIVGAEMFLDSQTSYQIKNDRISIIYQATKNASRLTVSWFFQMDFISLEPLLLESPVDSDIAQIIYFPEMDGGAYKPSMYSHYAVVPGLCMSTSINPVVDLHSRLSVTTVLGSGAMRGPGLTQQWGLPAHYFCTFNTSDKWNAIGAKALQSGAACWGLAELPQGDFRLEIREIGISPVLNLRSDIWKHKPNKLGFSFLIAFGENYHEAIRSYYKILQREKIIAPKNISGKKKDVMLAPQYNTWGVESSKAMKPEELTEEIVKDIFDKFQRSGMKARTFVIDDKWEGQYGELKHDAERFPHFENLLNDIRGQGYFIGLWAAFLRCQNPAALGLDESNLLQTPEGKPLWLDHQTSRYGIFDVTQPIVQKVLSERAKEFIRRYKPDLIKFDFGYELPSLDFAAPADMNLAGECLLQKGLEVVIGAMKEENPDLVIMYYGLSPLLIEHYDLHSPDDLVYCIGDYDLETNRRVFFSSLCGELGMPTYSSSGYEWESAPDIWFDTIASGTLGSLHCFDGDESGGMPTDEVIAKFNGLAAIARKQVVFQTYPVHAKWQGGLRAGFSPSWERIENDKTVLLALRTHNLDGKPAPKNYKDILHTDVTLVVASLTDDGISESTHLGIVPFGDGGCTISHTALHNSATIIEHYFSGRATKTQVACSNSRIEIKLQQTRNHEILEWIEIIFEKD
ncbi:TIM-barrel domain-containing protein [Candidatus Villigracilis affinis]|uniref:TIM-barrel domain-containing protein n=1 Tax=Candidatus Villigracilis affinis TaxID=3140682 RepID=UPI002A1F795E|nr:hypothetical protein [Anaerolineales bacterium]